MATTPACDGQIIHIGNAREEVTMSRLAGLVLQLLQADLRLEERGRRNDSVSRRCPDTTKLKQLTQFEARVDLAEGLRRTRDWYLANAA